MVYKYLGYGVTDSNGVAKLDHDAEGQELQHSYTGIGAGEIDVVASLDNPVSQGSIVSGTYNVLDCVSYDAGIYGDSNTRDVYYYTNGLTRTVETDGSGTTFSVTNGNSSALNFWGTSDGTPCIIEMDIVSMDSSLTLYGRDNITLESTSISINPVFAVGNTLKIKYDGEYVQIYYGDTPSTKRSASVTGNFGFYFLKSWSSSSWNLKIKNFKCYRI